MAIDSDLLQILACPSCKTPVSVAEGGTGLKCGHCGRVYPIRDEIPVMLVDEATFDPE